MNKAEIAQQALENAQRNMSEANYAAIMSGFAEKGIPADCIVPRENVFTYHAWRALGRTVKKGEHGVKITTYVPVEGKNEGEQGEGGENKGKYRMPRKTTVFHFMQTKPLDEKEGA